MVRPAKGARLNCWFECVAWTDFIELITSSFRPRAGFPQPTYGLTKLFHEGIVTLLVRRQVGSVYKLDNQQEIKVATLWQAATKN